jgi:predicted O-methyltransferase YrrM
MGRTKGVRLFPGKMDKLELYRANEDLQEYTDLYLKHKIPPEKFVGFNNFYAEDYNSHFVPFHADLFILATIHELVAAGVNMFLELGTYLGGSSLYMGQTLGLEVHTCEPHKVHYDTASRLLESFATVYNETGLEFLKRWLGTGPTAVPLIFIDSHGYGFKWELLEELRAVLATYKRGFVLIDNFKIEGRPEFGWDSAEGSSSSPLQECSLEYTGGVLREAGVTHVYLSDYRVKTSSAHGLRGACLIPLKGTADWEPEPKLGWKKQAL